MVAKSRQREHRQTEPTERALRFALFVRRALKEARAAGMTIADIETATGVSQGTFYRWRDASWTADPRGTQVRAFCVGLGIPPDAAFRLLEWEASPPADRPAGVHPGLPETVRRIMHTLNDPNVSEDDKRVVEGVLEMLAGWCRAAPRGTSKRRNLQ